MAGGLISLARVEGLPKFVPAVVQMLFDVAEPRAWFWSRMSLSLS
jgi:hypothetical protein